VVAVSLPQNPKTPDSNRKLIILALNMISRLS